MKETEPLVRLCRDEGIPFRTGEPLAGYTTFRIGGPASLFVECGSLSCLRLLAREAVQKGIPLFVLGKGSNVLFADEGFDGIVLHIGRELSEMRLLDDTTIHCQSGASLAALCEFARNNGLSGLEFAYGIPGSVGGAIYMNAGAYGGEMKDVLTRAEHIGRDGEEGAFEGDCLELSYRHSVYCSDEFVITAGVFSLQKDDPEAIAVRMKDYMGRRREKQPLEFPSAGSTFKRPAQGYASALIDQCGLKGLRVGGAQVSEKHAGFVINTGGATARDVLELVDRVREEVLRQTGILLEPEVKLIGQNKI